jgi:hypothetical protein
MAEVKISELTSATTPLAGTEVVPIVQGGVTKKVAVSEIGGGSGSVAWGDITGNLGDQTDLVSAFNDVDSAINTKQDILASGVNIKSINGNSIVGSGNLTTGLLGVHQLLPFASNDSTSASLDGNGLVPTFTTTNNRMVAYPFIPNVTFTTQNLYINVNTAVASSICRILIYSELNGRPDTKLYESANLDCSTLGQKTATTSFTFTAGTTYWLTCHSQGTPTLFGIVNTSLVPIKINSLAILTIVRGTAAIGSAPTTFSVSAFDSSNAPFIGITKA